MRKRILAFSVNEMQNRCLIPTGAKVLSVVLKDNGAVVYVWADIENGLEERIFVNYTTDEEVNFGDGLERRFIGSYLQDFIVYHLFELI